MCTACGRFSDPDHHHHDQVKGVVLGRLGEAVLAAPALSQPLTLTILAALSWSDSTASIKVATTTTNTYHHHHHQLTATTTTTTTTTTNHHPGVRAGGPGAAAAGGGGRAAGGGRRQDHRGTPPGAGGVLRMVDVVLVAVVVLVLALTAPQALQEMGHIESNNIALTHTALACYERLRPNFPCVRDVLAR